MKAVTIDHCVWVKLIDKDKNSACLEAASESLALRNYCLASQIRIYASTRVENYDAVAMVGEGDKERLTALFENYRVILEPSVFRLGDATALFPRGSTFGGLDLLSGPRSDPKKIVKFKALFGIDPASLPSENTGKKVHSWIADYDALLSHYSAGRDIFVTLDKHPPCFDITRRKRAKSSMNLLIQSPAEALEFIQKGSVPR